MQPPPSAAREQHGPARMWAQERERPCMICGRKGFRVFRAGPRRQGPKFNNRLLRPRELL